MAEATMVEEFLREHAVEDKDGTFNLYRLLITKEEVNKIISKLANEIDKMFAGQSIVVVSILKGAAYFQTYLSMALSIPHAIGFVTASSYKNSQQQGEVEALTIMNDIPKDRKIILVDELFDSGKTLQTVKEYLQSLGNQEIFTCTLFRKERKTRYPLPDLVGYDKVPDVWVVGWGLDDKQEKRNWPHLFAIPNSHNMFYDVDCYNKVRQSIREDIERL